MFFPFLLLSGYFWLLSLCHTVSVAICVERRDYTLCTCSSPSRWNFTLSLFESQLFGFRRTRVMSACFICNDVLTYCVHSTGWFITLSFSLLGNLWDIHYRAKGQVQCLPLLCLFLFFTFLFFHMLHVSFIHYISLMA